MLSGFWLQSSTTEEQLFALHYLRLIGYTTGTLLHLFLLAVVVGYRRPRALERVFFFVVLAQFLFFAGALLQVNGELYYAIPPPATLIFAALLMATGLGLLPPLLVHLHVEYQRAQTDRRWTGWTKFLLAAMYLPPSYFVWHVFPIVVSDPAHLTLPPGPLLGRLCPLWAAFGLAVCTFYELQFAKRASVPRDRNLLHGLAGYFAILVLATLLGFPSGLLPGNRTNVFGFLGPLVLWLLPSIVIAYTVVRHNWLQLGRQRNLAYAVSATFLALLYLAVIRRVSGWLEPVLPPEATISILLFVLVFLFEPLQRRVSHVLRRTLRMEVDRLQRLLAEFQQETRHGELRRLVSFVEQRIAQEFELLQVRLFLEGECELPAGRPDRGHRFPLGKGKECVGSLEVHYASGMLSGETYAALEFLAEQLPAMIGLCRLIEEKLKLERELAERERLALVGQMAASISHNLKNPLGSMKTVLQVQLENPELPESVRQDCALVVSEIDRLSAKLGQLLRYAKPSVRAGAAPQRVAALSLTEQLVALLGREAERRQVKLELERETNETFVRGSEEAFSDVLSNLVVNAIEVLPAGGSVRVRLARVDARLVLEVTDDGRGIPAEHRGKLFQPFFTTKPSGTGLGLAIVERRVGEMDGTVSWETPVRDGRGTKFTVTLPVAE